MVELFGTEALGTTPAEVAGLDAITNLPMAQQPQAFEELQASLGNSPQPL